MQVVGFEAELGQMLGPKGWFPGAEAGPCRDWLNRHGVPPLGLSRMNDMGAVAAASASLCVGAGIVLAKLHETLAGTGLMSLLHLGAEGSARIGGLSAANAGGSHAFRQRELIHKIKQALDPLGLMNPGVILHERETPENRKETT